MEKKIRASQSVSLDKYDQIISKRDALDSYNFRRHSKTIILILFVIFLAFGLIFAGRCAFFLWNDKESMFSVMCHVYDCFIGAIIAIFLDRVMRSR